MGSGESRTRGRSAVELSDAFMAQFSEEDADKYVKHYGVKGMHWGVIRSRMSRKGSSQPSATEQLKKRQVKDTEASAKQKLNEKKLIDLQPSKDAKEAGFVRTKAKVSGVSTLSNADLQRAIMRMNLEQQYKHLKTVEHEQSLIGAGQKYVGNLLTDILKDAGASWLKRPGSNASGRTSGRVNVRSWTTGQDFARVVDGQVVRKAIGS